MVSVTKILCRLDLGQYDFFRHHRCGCAGCAGCTAYKRDCAVTFCLRLRERRHLRIRHLRYAFIPSLLRYVLLPHCYRTAVGPPAE
jgi:hypothetical protein